MKTLTNPQEFCKILKNEKTFINIKNNFAMRQYISSYGFKATKELANEIFELRKKIVNA
jgi:hypothetical protein